MKRRVIFLIVGLLALAAALRAQPSAAQLFADTEKRAVCPLSDAQQDKAVRTFADVEQMLKSSPPRCINCHGALQPFAADTKHPGGRMDPLFTKGKLDVEKTRRIQCIICHDPPWQAPHPDDFWVDKNAVQLCKHFKGQFQTPQALLTHLQRDVLADFAYAGTRALNDNGELISEGEFGKPPKPEPPSFTRQDLLLRTAFWLDAQNGKFQGDEECGCKPHRYFLRFIIDMAIVADKAPPLFGRSDAHEDFKIPITFRDDGSFSGQASVDRNMSGTIGAPGRPPVVCTIKAVVPQEVWKVEGKPTDETVFAWNVTLTNTWPNPLRSEARCNVGGSAFQSPMAAAPTGVLMFQLNHLLDSPIDPIDLTQPPMGEGKIQMEWVVESAP